MADPSRLFAPSSEYVIEYDDFVLRLTASSDENTRTHAPKLESGIDENSKNRTVLVFGALDYTNMQIEFEARGSKGYTLERVALKHNRNKINETEKEITEIEELDIPEITTVDPSKNRQVHLTCDVDSNRGKYSGWRLKSENFGPRGPRARTFFTFVFIPDSAIWRGPNAQWRETTWKKTDITAISDGYSQCIQVNPQDFRRLENKVQKLTETVENFVREKASGLHTLEQMDIQAQTSSADAPPPPPPPCSSVSTVNEWRICEQRVRFQSETKIIEALTTLEKELKNKYKSEGNKKASVHFVENVVNELHELTNKFRTPGDTPPSQQPRCTVLPYHIH